VNKCARTGEYALEQLTFATRSLERALRINPGSVPVLRLYGSMCLELVGDVDRAERLFSEADEVLANKSRVAIKSGYDRFLEKMSLTLDIFDEDNGVVSISVDEHSMGSVEHVNCSFLRMLGFNSRNDILGKNINMIVPNPIRRFHDHYMKTYLHTRRSLLINSTNMMLAMHSRGHLVPCAMFARWSDEANGKMVGVLQAINNPSEIALIVEHGGMQVTSATENFASVFGFQKREVLSQRVTLFQVLPVAVSTSRFTNNWYVIFTASFASYPKMQNTHYIWLRSFLIFSRLPLAAIELWLVTTSLSSLSICSVSQRTSPSETPTSTTSAASSLTSPAYRTLLSSLKPACLW